MALKGIFGQPNPVRVDILDATVGRRVAWSRSGSFRADSIRVHWRPCRKRSIGSSGRLIVPANVMTDRSDTPVPNLVGRLVGEKYRIDSLLGVGGMGAVYAAFQTNLQRSVALKVMHPKRVHEESARKRFGREAVAIARLSHPNIVAIFDFDADDETGAFLVMERVVGGTLRDEIERRGQLPLDSAIDIFEPVCSAIATAHRSGVLHRDVKPQNILLELDGDRLVPKVVDFGLASIVDGDRSDGAALTRAGAMLGTPLYMAPEQADDRPLDARSDVYSLGCVLYEMLTGRPPFLGQSLGALLLKHVNEMPAPPSRFVPGLPEAVDRVVLKALAKLPDARFQSPLELAGALVAASTLSSAVASHSPEGERTPTRLPRTITSFVGASTSRRAIVDLLRAERLATLTGPGGIGKSRLALEVASELESEFPQGIWWVDLAPVALAGLVPGAVADILGVRSEGNRPLRDLLCERLASRRVLIVLDSCEHVLDACAALADAILRRCSGPVILATSQAAFNIAGERVFAVPALSVAAPTGDVSVADALALDAVRLFVERVRLQQPAFAITPSNVAVVLQLCSRLEGLPLAIELAAARTRVLSVDQILSKMDDRFRLLTGGVRNRPQRQQTLRAAIDWSHDLLDEPERALFRRLSVFAGGATLDAVESVCALPWDEYGASDVLDVLAQLVDRSLVTVGRTDSDPRYRMLETLRQYAAERLEQAGEVAVLRERHFEWCLSLAEGAGERMRPKVHEAALSEVERDFGNVRAALRWAIEHGRRAEDSLGLCVALMPFWEVRGHSGEGRRWLVDALAAAPDAESSRRVRALHAAGTLSLNVGDFERARTLYEECVALERGSGDLAAQAHTLRRLGDVFVRLGLYADAMACQTESRALSARLGDERGVALALSQMGMVGICVHDLDASRAWYEESLAVFRKLDQRLNVAVVLHNLAELKHRMGESVEAKQLLAQCLEIAQELGYKALVATSLVVGAVIDADCGDAQSAEATARDALAVLRTVDDKLGTSYALDAMARHAVLTDAPERAIRLSGAADAIRARLGSVLSPYERASLDRYLERARRALGDEDAARVAEKGRSTPQDVAVAFALSGASSSLE
jgi:predicted ATPase/serine/threonine protein kinase